MKKILIILIVLFSFRSYGQQLSGKLENLTDSTLSIRYSPDGITNAEKMITLNNKGEFSMKIPVQYQAIVRILTGDILQEIFLAPGLALNLRADIANKNSYSSTLLFTGSAAKYNQYFSLQRSNLYYQELDSNIKYLIPMKIPVDEKLRLLRKYKFTKDSLRQHFFSRFKNDKIAIKFETADSVETQYYILYTLWGICNKDIPKEERSSFLKDHITPYMTESDDPVILSGTWYKIMWMSYSHRLYFISKESGDTSWYTAKNEFERYCSNTDRIIKSKKLVEAIYATYYFGMLRDKYKDADEKDFPALDGVFERMMTRIKSKTLAEDLRKQNLIARELARQNRNGKPAVAFQLVDSSGKFYSLADFKNKILVLDLWASWCPPCIEEFPHMRKLQEKFIGREDIQFVTVSVDNFRSDWIEKGVHRFSPPGLALWAENGLQSSFYENYGSNGVPHIIVIDKKGFYLEYMAPYPSDGDKLEKLIKQALQ